MGPADTDSEAASFRFLLTHRRRSQGFREFLGESRDSGADPAPCLTMLWIPPGRFWMGSPDSEPERNASEGPQHLVQLPGFFMSQTPITQAQWREVAGWQERPGESWERELKPTPSRFRGDQGGLFPGEANADNRPVETVSWWDAMGFCQRLGQRTGRHYTLPSEAQWEYACRAGGVTPFHVGKTITPRLANYDATYDFERGLAGGSKDDHRQQDTPVGLFPANAWGLHDMHGNVWEWCRDDWHHTYEGAPADGNAWLRPDQVDRRIRKRMDGTVEPEQKMLRGGSWLSHPRGCRSAYRTSVRPDSSTNTFGFRVCCLPQD